MLGKSIISVLVISAMSSVSFATTSLNQILFVPKFLPNIEMNNIDKSTNIKGVDFSGKWSGGCKDFDGSAQLEIQQSEDSITINGQDFRFGAMTTSGYSNTDNYSNSQMRFTWNSMRTVLTLNGTSVNSNNNENMVYTSISTSSMSIESDQLVMKIQGKFYKNQDSMGDVFDRVCVFSKQR